MEQSKDQSLTDLELEKAAGGRAVVRSTGDPVDGGLREPGEGRVSDGPEPQVDEVTPLPDPRFGVIRSAIPE